MSKSNCFSEVKKRGVFFGLRRPPCPMFFFYWHRFCFGELNKGYFVTVNKKTEFKVKLDI
jgi:hypothetical protein